MADKGVSIIVGKETILAWLLVTKSEKESSIGIELC